MVFYKTTRLSPKVEIVAVEKFTDSSVWINGRRRARLSDWECYWPTIESALDNLEHEISKKIALLKRDLDKARSALGEVKSQKRKATV